MLELCLLALPWMADPRIGTQSKPENVKKPIATCVRPAVLVIETKSVCASPPDRIADLTTVNRWLKRWETATRTTPVRSRSEREDFRRRVHESFNEHTLAAAEQFAGQINANRLSETFEWRIIESDSNTVCLEAVPRDDLERLFYGSLRISLDTETASPAQLVIIGRNQIPQTVWQSDLTLAADKIELVHFENDVPPSPKSLVRTADAKFE